MDSRTLQGIEFASVLKLLGARCASASGAAAAGALLPATSSFEVDTLLDETDEAVDLLGAGEYMPLAAFDDPEEWLEDIRRRGGNLEGEKFLSILSLLNLASDVRRFVEERAERLPRLRMRIHGADMQYPLAARIRRILDERGEVRDDASPDLKESRTKQRALRAEIRRLLDRIMTAHPNAIQENLIVQRRERYLIPARTTFKRSFEGVIQDRSASGETLFVEPLSAVPVNNAIAEEREAERAEVERILRDLTAEVMEAREAIVYLVGCLAGLDLIWAKARLGVDWRGARAQASADGGLRLRAARHPLLTAGVGAVPKDEVVPIDLEVGSGVRQLLITGPNTGGKTVALKTVGLCAALHQCGVPIPAAPESALPVFKTLVADIGDEQDIQQNLSTFSGHMARVSGAVREAREGVLVLLDELGSGTDPAEGSAIGVSVLEHLAASGALCIVTTHHDALKHYAYGAAHAENASVEFDAGDLSPTYRIRMGAAGPSNAMSVAQKMGLPESVLSRADELLVKGPVQVDRLMANLSDQEREIEEKEADLSARRARVEERERELDRQLGEEARRRGDDAARFLKDLRREADDLLNEMRGALEMEEAKRIARERIREMSAKIEEALPRREEGEAARAPVSLRKGDRVRIPLMNCAGEVSALHGEDELTVTVNGKSLRLSLSVVEVLDDAPGAPSHKSTVTHDVESRGGDFSPELQLRGVRAERAVEMVDKYLDDAALVGIASVRIVHGKGEGVLSKVVAERLQEHALVSKFGPARPEEGGWGVTNVELALR